MELNDSIKALSDKIDAAANAAAEKSAASAAEIKALSDKCAAMSQDIQALQQSAIAPTFEEKKTMTFAEKLASNDLYRAFVDGRARSVRFALADIVTPAGAVAPETAGVAAEPGVPLNVEGLFAAASTASNLVEFVREASYTNAAAGVAEAAAKPESAMTFATVQAPVQTIAHYLRITKQLAADAPALASYISSRMAYGVAQKVEAQLVAGDGKAPNLSGIFAAGNYTAHGFGASDADSLLDLIALSISKVEQAGFAPTAALFNPVDWAKLAISKDGDKRYLLGDPAAADGMRVWGLPVVVSAAVPAGKFAVGDFRSAGTVFTRQGTVVELFEQDADNVTHNLVTVRAECRKALAIEHPDAIVGGALALA